MRYDERVTKETFRATGEDDLSLAIRRAEDEIRRSSVARWVSDCRSRPRRLWTVIGQFPASGYSLLYRQYSSTVHIRQYPTTGIKLLNPKQFPASSSGMCMYPFILPTFCCWLLLLNHLLLKMGAEDERYSTKREKRVAATLIEIP